VDFSLLLGSMEKIGEWIEVGRVVVDERGSNV
jgi:hypothetical protein